MSEITKLQYEILGDLYKIDIKKDLSKRVHIDAYKLEKDEIMRVRELVFNIDQLVELEFISTSNKYYIESDNMSFEYMNNAIEMIDNRINITPLGIQYIEESKKGNIKKISESINAFFDKSFLNHPYRVIGTHILSFILGLVIMWVFLRVI